MADESEELTEGQYAEQLRAFRAHAAVFAAVNLGIFVVNLAINLAAGIADIWWAWWSAWSIIGWGIGVAVHGLVVRGQRPAPQGAERYQRPAGRRPRGSERHRSALRGWRRRVGNGEPMVLAVNRRDRSSWLRHRRLGES